MLWSSVLIILSLSMLETWVGRYRKFKIEGGIYTKYSRNQIFIFHWTLKYKILCLVIFCISYLVKLHSICGHSTKQLQRYFSNVTGHLSPGPSLYPLEIPLICLYLLPRASHSLPILNYCMQIPIVISRGRLRWTIVYRWMSKLTDLDRARDWR